MTDVDQIAASLRLLVAEQCGDGARLIQVAPLEGGHAGLTFGFAVESGNANDPAEYVLKLAPAGVRRSGNTDVYRQAPLLRALHGCGLAVPDIPWASPAEDLFGVPYVVMEKLPGRTFFLWDPDPRFAADGTAAADLWLQAMDVLADLHSFDWRRHIPQWEAPRSLGEEVARWSSILEKSPDPAMVERGLVLRDRLLATQPETRRMGLVHGDYQPGNALYEDGRITGIIDWELACIGDQGTDIGWALMLADPENWDGEWHTAAGIPTAALFDRYAARLGGGLDYPTWYQAMAGYRLGAISCMNVHLHRSGRRLDDVWEHFWRCVDRMFARAHALLDGLTTAS